MPRLACLLFALIAAILLPGLLARADIARAVEPTRPLVETICPLMEKEAVSNGLPPAFFIRLIWRESAFRPNAVSHKGAQGIAQFMPATAKERGLEDPFEPASAISHSAQLLADLKRAFGNLGLAAAAYNAGPERVRAWLDGERVLPAETHAYVKFITGHAPEHWKDAEAQPPELTSLTSAELQAACRRRAPALVYVALPKSPDRTDNPPPWGVQLATDFSRGKVAGMFNALKQRHAKVLANAAPIYVPERNLSRGRRSMIALRIGADTREKALKLCQRLRNDGGICTVQKN
jgi:hypothetical protein